MMTVAVLLLHSKYQITAEDKMVIHHIDSALLPYALIASALLAL